MIGAVSASKNVTNDISSSDVTDDFISQTDDNEVSQVDNEIDNKVASSNNEPIKEEYKETSFKALNKTINEATTDTIELKNDYIYDKSSDSEFKNGIIISKSITINGNGKTIDANKQARIFKVINGANLIIENLKFTNGQGQNDGPYGYIVGGAIYVNKSYVTIINSTFNDNQANGDCGYGGAICSENSNITIVNSTFNNNKAYSYENIIGAGGAIRCGGNATIINSTFNNNNAEYDGGAIYADNNVDIMGYPL